MRSPHDTQLALLMDPNEVRTWYLVAEGKIISYTGTVKDTLEYEQPSFASPEEAQAFLEEISCEKK